MILFRKFRYLISLLRQHLHITVTFLIITLLCGIFFREIIYTLYINTVNLNRYRAAITIWSTDYHISPIHDLKTLLSPMGVEFLDKSLSYSCALTKTCYSPLLILTRANGMNLSEKMKRRFYEFYRDQIEMNLVDIFVCFHPAAMCELYMPFNRTIIIIASTRYELARFSVDQWQKWNENLKRIAQDSRNVIAANNLYDAEYIRYFTGINATVLPSFCQYTDVAYKPKRKEFLLAPIHMKIFEDIFLKWIDQSRSSNIQIVRLRDLYPKYQYSDLTHHPAIIHLPYQVSIMSIFEQYRMNIPLVVPSLDLLTQWHFEYQVVVERTWDMTLYGRRLNHSTIKGALKDVPDPNNELDRHAIRYWLKFADFYQWPHIVYFESIDDLMQKLVSTDFRRVSEKMKIYNQKVKDSLHHKWGEILSNVKKQSKKFRSFSN